jgi:hypothetical protein
MPQPYITGHVSSDFWGKGKGNSASVPFLPSLTDEQCPSVFYLPTAKDLDPNLHNHHGPPPLQPLM